MCDFSKVGGPFESCLKYLSMFLEWCLETNVILNWEKFYFMVKEGIILRHTILGKFIEVDQTNIEVISKLSTPISMRGVRTFLATLSSIGISLKNSQRLLTLCANP